jgi:hypothetical protein
MAFVLAETKSTMRSRAAFMPDGEEEPGDWEGGLGWVCRFGTVRCVRREESPWQESAIVF